MVKIHEGKLHIYSFTWVCKMFGMQGYEKYIPEWFEQKEEVDIAFKRNLTEIGFEIVQLRPFQQEYFFESVNTVSGT